MGRLLAGVLAGVVTAFVVVLAIESAGLPLFPPPAGMDPLNAESVRQHLAEIHPGSFVMVLVAWSAAAIAGPWVTRRVAGDAPAWPALLVALLFFVLCVYNLVAIPSPLWMKVLAIVLVPIATWLGFRIPIRRTA